MYIRITLCQHLHVGEVSVTTTNDIIVLQHKFDQPQCESFSVSRGLVESVHVHAKDGDFNGQSILPHAGNKCAVHVEDCEGWWSSGCRGSVAEHWRLKPEVFWV